MRFTGKKPSGRDRDVDVYTFTIGTDELRTLRDILDHYYRGIPRTFETNSLLGRLRNMRKRITAELPMKKGEAFLSHPGNRKKPLPLE